MNGYFAAGRLSEDEKNDILKLHSSVYNGYRTMQPEVKNEQPLYVYDPAQDKVGVVMNNKGEIKAYTNFGINESTEQKEVCDECGSMMMEGECTECGWKGNMDEHSQDGDPQYTRLKEDECKECGGMMTEGECSECGWKGEVGDMEEGVLGDVGKKVKDWMNKPLSPDVEDYISKFIDVIDNPEKKDDEEEDDEDFESHKIHRRTGKFKKHQYTESEVLEYETGHLDDIYDEQDLNPNAEFDYVKGASNKTNAFHVKEQAEDYINYDDNEDPDNEDDGYEDINASEVTDEIEEQGGNAPDFNISNVDDAYTFIPNGPMAGGDSFPVYEDLEEECDECWDKMESAWSDELDEIDVSGAQGIYGAMKKPYEFHSEGAGKAGPYQHSQYENKAEDEDVYWDKDLDDDELDLDFEKFNPRDKSWEEITAHTGDDEFGGVDEDIKESLILQKNKIMEMMNRMKVI